MPAENHTRGLLVCYGNMAAFVSAYSSCMWMMDTETSVWSPEEIEAYQQAMMKYDKDFFLVSKQVKERLCVFHHRRRRHNF